MPSLTTQSAQVGNIFREAKPLVVPRFQRNFSWDSEKVEQLWEDTWQSINDGGDTYFLGSIVVKDSPAASVVEVIDGQQRLTTLSLLLCALRDAADAYGHSKKAMQIEIHYLASGTATNGDEDDEIQPKLTPNQINRAFYVEKILNNPQVEYLRMASKGKKEDKSNKLMAQAYLLFRDKIDIEVKSGKGALDVINDLLSAIDNRLQVIRIAVADDYDAYLLFETLNDRGLALSVADLLKNHLFSRAENRLAEVQENWDAMQAYLEGIETKRFLRHVWLSESGVVRDKELFKKIKSKFDDKKSVFNLSRNLRDSAEYYGALQDAESEIWTLFDPVDRRDIRKNIDTLSVFRVNQYNPLLLSSILSSPSSFPNVVDLVVKFAFRYSIIGNGGTGNIEKAFSNAAVKLRKHPDSSIEEIFAEVAHLYPTDEEFVREFSRKSVTQSAIARYILRTINDWLGDDSVIANPDSYVLNLEHVLPKKFRYDDWAKFSGDGEADLGDFVDRLGNMILLKVGLNSQSSNRSFAEKIALYRDHEPLPVSKYVYAQDEWTAAAIDEHQSQMAELARKIWALPYA